MLNITTCSREYRETLPVDAPRVLRMDRVVPAHTRVLQHCLVVRQAWKPRKIYVIGLHKRSILMSIDFRQFCPSNAVCIIAKLVTQ